MPITYFSLRTTNKLSLVSPDFEKKSTMNIANLTIEVKNKESLETLLDDINKTFGGDSLSLKSVGAD
jgi:ACT domain-containing protein